MTTRFRIDAHLEEVHGFNKPNPTTVLELHSTDHRIGRWDHAPDDLFTGSEIDAESDTSNPDEEVSKR